MKTLLETGAHDFIIDQYYRVEKDPENWREAKYVDKIAGTAKHNNFVSSIMLYVNERDISGNLTGRATKLELVPQAILELAEKIKEINKSSFIAIVDPDDL